MIRPTPGPYEQLPPITVPGAMMAGAEGSGGEPDSGPVITMVMEACDAVERAQLR